MGFRSLTNQGVAIDSTTVAGAVAATSTGNVTLISSGTGSVYVYGYSLSVALGSTSPVTVRLMSGSTTAECWRTVMGNSTAVANTAESNFVSPPAYLFRTVAGDPLTYEKGASSAANALQHYALSFWRA